ncbi:unnamed protein product [Ilex paraguariensis]|uniref:Uncharacterized protein n=1 Tax=Ilex paraguariensis TaxID=185542 RepID=A0ABC8SXW5_9AQUA
MQREFFEKCWDVKAYEQSSAAKDVCKNETEENYQKFQGNIEIESTGSRSKHRDLKSGFKNYQKFQGNIEIESTGSRSKHRDLKSGFSNGQECNQNREPMVESEKTESVNPKGLPRHDARANNRDTQENSTKILMETKKKRKAEGKYRPKVDICGIGQMKNKHVGDHSNCPKPPNVILANQEELQQEMKESLEQIREDTKEPLKQLRDNTKESLKQLQEDTKESLK